MTIVGSDGTTALAVQISRLQNSPFTFALTGSRKHGGVHITSDYDFFAQSQFEVIDWLVANDFEQLTDSNDIAGAYPDDPNIADVFRWFQGGQQIDIQLVRDFDKKLRIDDIIFRTGVIHGLDKMQKRRLWKAMYLLLED